MHVIFLKCDYVIENIQMHIHDESSFFLGLKFCTNVKNKYENGIFYCFFFLRKKKSLDLQKIDNHVATFPYWFRFGNNFFKCLDRFLYLVII
jgi:hypothetical protein